MLLRLRWLPLLAVALALAGCEEAVDPTFDASRPYTLYGALDPTADTVAIRVVPIRDRIEPPPPGPLGGEARLVSLADGSVTPLRDSVVVFPGGTVGHVVMAPFTVGHGQSYRVEVERADGVLSAATVTVPPLSQGQARPVRFLAGRRVIGDVVWPQAPQILRAYTVYRIENEACQLSNVERPFTGEIRAEGNGMLAGVEISQDAAAIAAAIGEQPALIHVTLYVQIASTAWAPPGGVFDPEALVEPGVFTNVENGFGFVGSAYWQAFQWRPQDGAGVRFYDETSFRPRALGSCG